MNKKVILITGATSGIGYQTAEKLANQGHIVYGVGRNLEKIGQLKNVKSLYMDITDENSIKTVVNQIIEEQNKIDILVNNAGYGSYGAIEDVSIEEGKRQFEVNLFGLARLTQFVLPQMRKQREGRIINISSMGGRFTNYFGAWYHATKYALEAFSDALRMEVKDFGIDVSIIEPGGIKTEWGHIAADKLAQSSTGGVYEERALKMAKAMHKQYNSKLLSNPNIVSNAISKAVNNKTPKVRYLIGFGAKPLVFLHAILPSRLFDSIVMNVSR